jgi:hypothetical protein
MGTLNNQLAESKSMTRLFRYTTKSCTAAAVCVGLMLSMSSANAGYTVIDDDLLPTVFTEQSQPARYVVMFPKKGGGLTDGGRSMLDALIPSMRGAMIRVVGRPDAMAVRGKSGGLAEIRAGAMRSYLTRQGIPFESITVEIDNSPNPQANGTQYPSDIYVTKSSDRAARPARPVASFQPMPAYQATAVGSAAPTLPALPAVAPVMDAAARDRLVQYINQAVMSGQMDPAVALKLLQTQLDVERAQLASRVAASPTQQARAEYQAVSQSAAVSPAPVSTWVLDKRMSLHENIDAWSRLAGWAPSVWEATGAFQITANANINGDFPGILRQIADSTGLNICAKTRERYVRITDANVACK